MPQTIALGRGMGSLVAVAMPRRVVVTPGTILRSVIVSAVTAIAALVVEEAMSAAGPTGVEGLGLLIDALVALVPREVSVWRRGAGTRGSYPSRLKHRPLKQARTHVHGSRLVSAARSLFACGSKGRASTTCAGG